MKRTRLSIKFGPFCITVSPKRVDVESSDGQWRVQFGNRTKEYAQILYLVTNKDAKAIKAVTAMLYHTTLIVSDTEFMSMFNDMVKKYYKKSEEKKKVPKKEDETTLEEERKIQQYKDENR